MTGWGEVARIRASLHGLLRVTQVWETWPRGRRHSPAKGASGPKPGSRVRIPPSPPPMHRREKRSDYNGPAPSTIHEVPQKYHRFLGTAYHGRRANPQDRAPCPCRRRLKAWTQTYRRLDRKALSASHAIRFGRWWCPGNELNVPLRVFSAALSPSQLPALGASVPPARRFGQGGGVDPKWNSPWTVPCRL